MKYFIGFIKAGVIISYLTSNAISQTIDAPHMSGSPNSHVIPSIDGKTHTSMGNSYSSDLFNGSYNIYIPIYSFENAYGNYGVGLSYNTKGVMVDEMPSEVGLHWNLSAGGFITRTIKDMPDELLIDYEPLGPGYNIDCGYDIQYYGKLAYNYNSSSREYYSNGNFDQEHDDFTVNCAGMRFTFNIGLDGFIFTHPNKHVKIEILNGDEVAEFIPKTDLENNESFVNWGFRITDDKGIIYIFKPSLRTIWVEPRHYMTLECVNISIGNVPFSWTLDKIIFPDGNQINYFYSSSSAYTSINHLLFNIEENESEGVRNVNGSSSSYDKVRLQKITYPNNQIVKFVYMNSPSCVYGDYILDSIYVIEENKKLSYVFNHDIVASSPNTNKFDKRESCETLTTIASGLYDKDYYRLFLKNIELYGFDGEPAEMLYSFKYNNIKLPHYKSPMRDFMGYFNGDESSILSGEPFNSMPSFNLYNGVSRNYNGNYAQAGLLTEITNTYGGVTKYFYEPHSECSIELSMTAPYEIDNSEKLYDGVRIKKIENLSGANPDQNKLVTEFIYENGQQFTPFILNRAPAKYLNYNTIKYYYYYSEAMNPMLLVNGSNIGYGKVTSISKNGLNQVLGKVVSYFTNLSDEFSTAEDKYFRLGSNRDYWELPYTDRQYLKDWEIGLEYKTEFYDFNNNPIKVIEQKFRYSLDTISSLGNVENIKSQYAKSYISTDFTFMRYDSVYYRPFSGNVFLERTITKNYYSNTNYVLDTVLYTYNQYNKIHKTETTNSEGKNYISYTIYNTDIEGLLPHELDFEYPVILEVGMERWIKDSYKDPNSMYLLESSVFLHRKFDNKLRKSARVYMSRFNQLMKDYDFAGYTFSDVNFTPNRFNYIKEIYQYETTPTNFQMVTSVNEYDNKNRSIEVSVNENMKTSSVIYDDLSGNVLASVTNAQYSEIGFTGFDESWKSDTIIHFTSDILRLCGNFYYGAHGISNENPVCGNLCYDLDATGHISLPVIDFNGTLAAGKKYILQFWAKGGIPTVQGSGFSTLDFIEVYQKDEWKFYTTTITPTTSSTLQIIDNAITPGVKVDEIRLYPEGAQMVTNTYQPFSGKIAETTMNGRLTFYEYDNLGRLILIRDQDGNVLKKYERATN